MSTPKELSALEQIVVIGAGQMGRGIAQVAAATGYRVSLCDASVELAEAGREKIAGALDRLVKKGKLEADEARTTVERILAVETDSALPQADFVVEAATENPELKFRIFEHADALVPAHAVLASNTSSIPITDIALHTAQPERVVGMHFMNPVPVMKLVELIQGKETSAEVLELTRALAEKMGKTTIVSQDRPGFVVNRILIPLLNEACLALQEGLASAEDIDTGARLGLNHPMGPLELADLIGLDTVLSIAEVLHTGFGDDKYRPASLLREKVGAGQLGRKTGEGFFRYDERGRKLGEA